MKRIMFVMLLALMMVLESQAVVIYSGDKKVYDSKNTGYNPNIKEDLKAAVELTFFDVSDFCNGDITYSLNGQNYTIKVKDYVNCDTLILSVCSGYVNGGAFNDFGKVKSIYIYTDVDGISSGSFRQTYPDKVVILKREGQKEIIPCPTDAFDYMTLDGQTDVKNDFAFLTTNWDLSQEAKDYYFGNPVICDVNSQSSRNTYRSTAQNGWQQFIGHKYSEHWKGTIFSTFSIDTDVILPKDEDMNSNKGLAFYTVVGYKNSLVEMKQLNKDGTFLLPANTGVVVYSDDTNMWVNTCGNKHDAAPYSETNYMVAMSDKTETVVAHENGYRNFSLCKLSDTKLWEDGKIDYFAFFRISRMSYDCVNYAYLSFPDDIYTDSEGDIAGLESCMRNYGSNVIAGVKFVDSNEDEATGITNTALKNKVKDNIPYSLSGKRLSSIPHGEVFIMNGTKFILSAIKPTSL